MFVLVLMMVVFMAVSVIFLVMVMMLIVRMMVAFVRVRVSMRHATSMRMFVAVCVREVDVELYSLNGGFVSACDMQVIAVQFELFQFVL
jgi:hypothetical protein